MTKLTVSGDLSRQLTVVQKCVELCDDTGHTIGFFTPAFRDIRAPSISNEELDRREADDPIYRTHEVLAHLRSL
jgi:hypothetical protein